MSDGSEEHDDAAEPEAEGAKSGMGDDQHADETEPVDDGPSSAANPSEQDESRDSDDEAGESTEPAPDSESSSDGEPSSDDSEPARVAATDDPAAAKDGEPSSDRKKKKDGPSGDDLVPSGNPMRWRRGGLLIALGVPVPLLLMCLDGRWRWSVLVGGIGCLVAAIGVLDLIGSFDDSDDDRVAHRSKISELWPHLLEIVSSVALLLASLTLAVAGTLPYPRLTSAVLVTGAFVWMIVALFRTGQAIGLFRERDPGEDRPRPLWRRHGFWVLMATTGLYLPLLGSYSLSDPWEAHYGEVAREMLARDDWISLWWAQDGWFWSKPILNFWIQGLFFSLLGVRYMPDQMVASVANGGFPLPEWGARMPVFMLTLAGVFILYKGCSKALGGRGALLGALVLVSTPYFFFISHQTMTDMPYVAPLSASFGFMLLAFGTDSEQLARLYEVDLGIAKFRLSGFHLLFGLILVAAIPQIFYLVSRNLTLQVFHVPHGFRPHWDEFWAGSGGGNCGLPGNQGCKRHLIPIEAKAAQPVFTALFWAFIAGIVLWLNRGERRLQRLYFLAAWFCVAIAAMGKGAPGLVLPIFVMGAYIAATGRFRDLTRIELLSGLLIILCVALPWYVQMYVRHGQPFTDRLLFHDMYKRAFVHVHDTNVGDDVSFRYYIWQLGYGLFPWTGLSAGGLVWWLRKRADPRDATSNTLTLLVLWFVSAFAMFTISLTKFHHYIFPVVPPTAMLTGALLDRALGATRPAPLSLVAKYVVGLGVGSTLLVYGVFRWFPGSLTGVLGADGEPRAPIPFLAATCLALGLGALGFTIWRFGSRLAAPAEGTTENPTEASKSAASTEEEKAERDYESLALGAVGVASAVVVGLAGRDLFTDKTGDIDANARLMHLFTYNYRRPWPDSLDYEGILKAFTAVACVLCLLLVVRKWRPHVTATLCAVGLLFGAWGVNVYLYKLAPHWGQRETVIAYYQARQSPDEPLVAYQMNWKGENFYTGNRIPAFVSTGAKFKKWLEEQKKAGVNTMYFTTEHGRIRALQNELGHPKSFEVLTTTELNNKFMIARVRWDQEPTASAPRRSGSAPAP